MSNTSFNAGAFDGTNILANGVHRLTFESFTTGQTVVFKPFIKALKDSYKSNWERKPVYGRSDPIHTFKNTERTINLTWDVVAGSPDEAVNNLTRISSLTQMLYPSYRGSEVHLIHKAPIMRIKFMNLITSKDAGPSGAGLLATVDGFDYSISTEFGFLSNPKAGDGRIFPKVIEISCTIYPLHEFTLGSGAGGNFNTFPYGSKEVASTDSMIYSTGPAAQVASIFNKITNALTPPRITKSGGGLNENRWRIFGGNASPGSDIKKLA